MYFLRYLSTSSSYHAPNINTASSIAKRLTSLSILPRISQLGTKVNKSPTKASNNPAGRFKEFKMNTLYSLLFNK